MESRRSKASKKKTKSSLLLLLLCFSMFSVRRRRKAKQNREATKYTADARGNSMPFTYTHTPEIAKMQNPHGSSEGSISNCGGGDSGTSSSSGRNGISSRSSATKKSLVAAMPCTSRVPSSVVRHDAKGIEEKGKTLRAKSAKLHSTCPVSPGPFACSRGGAHPRNTNILEGRNKTHHQPRCADLQALLCPGVYQVPKPVPEDKHARIADRITLRGGTRTGLKALF